uniref:Phosducin domain-containing protein n=1 Tax=Macrostomum lignano TaxID=282301 RepID=A0A1I8HA66_9PLAT
MSASSQDFWRTGTGVGVGTGLPRKVAKGRAQGTLLSSTKSMDNLNQTAASEQSSVPQIDLTNFDSPEFDCLDYVLTSPRSLEACHRLGLQPVRLLYKRLQDFELENPGLPVAQLFELYDQHEAERKASLSLARQEREKLMAAEEFVENDSAIRSKQQQAAPLLSNGGTDSGNWESQIRRELADHEVQAERLTQRLETRRLRRLVSVEWVGYER